MDSDEGDLLRDIVPQPRVRRSPRGGAPSGPSSPPATGRHATGEAAGAPVFFRSAGGRRSWRTPGAGELIDINFRAPDDELGSARSLASGSV